jgi:hypothetical protein
MTAALNVITSGVSFPQIKITDLVIGTDARLRRRAVYCGMPAVLSFSELRFTHEDLFHLLMYHIECDLRSRKNAAHL